MMQTVIDNVGVVFTWSVRISKYGNWHKYSHKVREKKREKEQTLILLLTMLVHCSCGLCTFPNMVINANIARKSGGKRQKRIDMMQTVVDSVGVVLTWSVHISKQGNQ